MTAQYVPDRLTPMTTDELVAGMAGGYRKAMGSEPSAQTLAILVAQASLETGNGKKIHCWNLGNVKASPGWDGLVTMYPCDERGAPALAQKWIASGGRRTSVNADGTWTVWFDPPHPQTRFRAFETAADGCAEFVEFLATRDRYRAAWSEAFNGNADAFVRALGKAGYFTANVDTYAKAVVSITARALPACRRLLESGASELTDEERGRISDLVAYTLASEALGWVKENEPERLS